MELKYAIWDKTCFTCKKNGGYFYGHGSRKITCSLLNLNTGGTPEQKAIVGKNSIGGGVPNPAFRVPNTSEKYQECPFWEEQE